MPPAIRDEFVDSAEVLLSMRHVVEREGPAQLDPMELVETRLVRVHPVVEPRDEIPVGCVDLLHAVVVLRVVPCENDHSTGWLRVTMRSVFAYD